MGTRKPAETERIDLDALEAGAAEGRRRPVLVMVAGGTVGRPHALPPGRTDLGRDRSAGLPLLEGNGVSRRHARVEVDERGAARIRDLGSTNGTWVNGIRIDTGAHRPLADGDKVRIGSLVLKFLHQDGLDRRFHEEMFARAVRDPLTGCHNRTHFEARLAEETAYARRQRIPLSLLLIDLDDFKTVNDRWGHPAGDHLLTRFAAAVPPLLRTEDLFARIGGDEFAILLRRTDTSEARGLARRIGASLDGRSFPWGRDGVPLRLRLSVGIATLAGLPEECRAPTDLYEAADRDLYRVKGAPERHR